MNETAIRAAMEGGSRIDGFTSTSALTDIIRWMICDTLKVRGQQMSNDMLEACAAKVAEVLMRDHPSLTDKELALVMEAGISGELGKETWVSGASILQWIRAYDRNVSRINIIDEQKEQKERRQRKTQAEVEELDRQAYDTMIHSAYDYYRKHGTIFGTDKDGNGNVTLRGFTLPQWAAIVYGHYRAEGKIPEPTEQRYQEAVVYADMQLSKGSTREEHIRTAREDWMGSYMLERYFSDVANGRL